ncbi:hypothetical protein ABW21_db0209770 [Orbilia brochopaga]|nr:hypothetical protein ABW21_db0209770 [Drechslerella brochopaga]
MSQSQDHITGAQSQSTKRSDDDSGQEASKNQEFMEVYNRSNYEGSLNRNKDKMGSKSVFLLIVNRMIGTGIFEQPSTVLAGCGSLGASLLLWLLGGLIAFSGLMVHIEFGLMVPRYSDRYGRHWKCIPRSGGEKNYFEYLFNFVRLDLLPVCVYGLIFLFLGNTAGNSYIFAQYFLRMTGVTDAGEWTTKGVAVAVITFACVMHSIWRKGGIYLLNGLAVIKILILWAIIILGYAARGGAFEDVKNEKPPAWVYFEPDRSFKGRSTGFYGWAIAILSVLYAFGGYENANCKLYPIY